VTKATLAHRLGTLRMFFVRIDEWGWGEAPVRVPMFPGDLPRQDHPLPKALDAAAAKLLRAAQNDRKPLVRVSVEVLLRTGLRVSEYTGLRSDAVVQIGAAPWLHVPVGKLREDRYLPLHPNLVALIDDYRARFVPPEHPLLLPRPNGTALDRHTVTRMINRAGKVAGLPHIHPHQLRHTLATQASNRGMSLEARDGESAARRFGELSQSGIKRLGELLVGGPAGKAHLAGNHTLECLPTWHRSGHGTVYLLA
jgi:integrase